MSFWVLSLPQTHIHAMSSLSSPRLCSLLLLLLPLLPTLFTFSKEDCQSTPAPLLARNESSPWTSPSGEFALGFHLLDDQKHFLLAVWFNKVEDPTIVWSANRDKPAPPSSKFELNSTGVFVLSDPNGKELWSAQTNGSKSACAVILDTGNFVILDENYSPVWESFRLPTDTILPGQILRMPTSLKSRRSKTDYAAGDFQLRLQEDGNLVLYIIRTPDESDIRAYWATGSMNWKLQLILDEAGSIYIKDENMSVIRNITRDESAHQMFYYMARIDDDGIFRLYKHPKREDDACDGSCSLSWAIVQEIPKDICISFNGYGNGGGWCGYNSICQKRNSGISLCLCPPRYTFIDASDPEKGCKPDFPLPSCQADGWETSNELVDFIEIPNTNWPYADYDTRKGPMIDEKSCKKLCTDDCFCAAITYIDHQCWLKRHPLANGATHKNISESAFLKVPKGELKIKTDRSSLDLAMAVLLGSSGFLNILLLVAVSVALLFINKQKQSSTDVASTSTMNVRRYTYKELEKATGGFKQILGRGASGKVYKGVLASDPKRFVAVKMLEGLAEEGEKEFKAEVSAICQTHHKNLVRLLGYCDEGSHRLLVYEYMSNGSLATFLFVGISRPHWNQRVQIAFGIARGLMYLHEECSTQIIHCDIKPQNILLDENFTPRISDFGLAKLLLANQSKIHTQRRGTIGYFAPEWFRKASISVKVDVYSFGVMLLEIICCKTSLSFAMESEEDEALVDWAYNCYKEKRLEKIVENDEEARNDLERVERLVIIAIWCIQEDPSLRPTMKKVTQMLEGMVDVFVPPRPSLFVSTPPLIASFKHL